MEIFISISMLIANFIMFYALCSDSWPNKARRFTLYSIYSSLASLLISLVNAFLENNIITATWFIAILTSVVFGIRTVIIIFKHSAKNR